MSVRKLIAPRTPTGTARTATSSAQDPRERLEANRTKAESITNTQVPSGTLYASVAR